MQLNLNFRFKTNKQKTNKQKKHFLKYVPGNSWDIVLGNKKRKKVCIFLFKIQF